MTTIRDLFLRACWLDVAVRKPGNVSVFSAGHRMQAEQFVASAQAAAAPLPQRKTGAPRSSEYRYRRTAQTGGISIPSPAAK